MTALLAILPGATGCCKGEFIQEQNIDPKLEVGLGGEHPVWSNIVKALWTVPPWLRTALHMEFGVREGTSINRLASLTGNITRWDGFDSFQGLPSDSKDHVMGWSGGRYTLKGKIPQLSWFGTPRASLRRTA